MSIKGFCYYRVSTQRQGRSGLGLEAQKEAIQNFARLENIDLIGEFTDVESGGDNNRDGLNKAIVQAKLNNAIIIVAKLDRLSRDVHFISGLMCSGVKFVVAELGLDVPPFMLHIFAAFAEEEKRKIGKRTKEALRQAKGRGVKLGTDIPQVKRAIAEGKRQQSQRTLDYLVPAIKEARANGANTFRKLADWLNSNGYKTPRGKQFYPSSLTKIVRRAENLGLLD